MDTLISGFRHCTFGVALCVCIYIYIVWHCESWVVEKFECLTMAIRSGFACSGEYMVSLQTVLEGCWLWGLWMNGDHLK